MATKNRSDLKSYFVKNAIPTEGNFADLIDSQLNQAQDGVFKPDGEALSVTAAPGDQKRVLRLYASYPAASPDWMISLHPAQDPANAATTGKSGLGITDGAGKTRLFIDAATGQIGVGTNTPQVALDVTGGVQANGFRGRYDLVLNDYRTVNPASNTCLQSPANDRDAWIYRDPADAANNWGIYHRQIDTAVGGLPANSIGFVGGSGSKLQAYISLGDGSGYFAGNLTAAGGIEAQGSYLKVKGGGNEQCYFGGDGIGNNVEVGSTGSTVMSLVAWNTVKGCMDFTCRTLTQTSDERSKDNIEPIPGALDKVVCLRGVSFDWKADNRPEGSQKQLGLVAQQVRQVVPEAVVDAKGGLSIAYNAITALLIEAVKEQQKHIDELRAALTPTPA
jgi:hypothetical protein